MTVRDVLPGPGDIVAGKYLVEQFLGAGGMGVVVAARHLGLRQRVAIKFLGPEAENVPSAAARFVREAQATAAIQSEHVARILDVGKLGDGAPYIVMEYLSGLDLSHHLKGSGPMSLKESADLVIQTSLVIAEAHVRKIVHRDLKPSNIFLTRRIDGSLLVKVLDFGLSKVSFFDGETKPISLTGAETVIGSPHYMSPEQVQSLKGVDERTDIWSLGVILYVLLTGNQPFTGRSAAAVCASVVVDNPLSMHNFRPDLPESIETLVFACLEKAPERRLQTVAEIAAGLAPFASSESRPLVERIYRLQSGSSTAGSDPMGTETPRPSRPSLSERGPRPSRPSVSDAMEPSNDECTDAVKTMPLGTKRLTQPMMQETPAREAPPSEPQTWDELTDGTITVADPTPPIMPEVNVTPTPAPRSGSHSSPQQDPGGAPDGDFAGPESVRLPLQPARRGLGIAAIVLASVLATIAVGAVLRQTPTQPEVTVAPPARTGAPGDAVPQAQTSEPSTLVESIKPVGSLAPGGAYRGNPANFTRPPPRPSQAPAKEPPGAARTSSPLAPPVGSGSTRPAASPASTRSDPAPISPVSTSAAATSPAATPTATSSPAATPTATSSPAATPTATSSPAPSPEK